MIASQFLKSLKKTKVLGRAEAISMSIMLYALCVSLSNYEGDG